MEIKTQTFKGELEFIDLMKPIKIHIFQTAMESVNIQPLILTALSELNGKLSSLNDTLKEFHLKIDSESNRVVKFDYNNGWMKISLENKDGWSNLGLFIHGALRRFNGRKVIFTLANDNIKIEPDPSEKCPDVYYTHNNSCMIEPDHVKNICKPGTHDTCIFLTLTHEGFWCEKFGDSADTLMTRHIEGRMKANQVGNCALSGRKDAPKPKIKLSKWPNLQQIVADKEKYIGWTLIDSGSSMDRAMFGNSPLRTKVTDITFELNEDETGASFLVIGEGFTCGFEVTHGGSVGKYRDTTEIHFHGFMGHTFMIAKI